MNCNRLVYSIVDKGLSKQMGQQTGHLNERFNEHINDSKIELNYCICGSLRECFINK